MKQLLPAEKPWVICRLGVKPPSHVIRRYINRQDADSASGSDVGASGDLRVMTRFVQVGGRYAVAFDVIEIEE